MNHTIEVQPETLARNLQPTYEEFLTLPDWERAQVAASNRVIGTDAYNRTMDHLRGPEGWREEETYVLQMRRSPYGYHVAAGIEDAAAELTTYPITQEEVDFAEAYYNDRNIPFFNKDMWQAIIDEEDGKLPIEIHGVPDGTITLPGEPMLRVTGPGELIAHFEHVFHRPYYMTLVATKAHEITDLLGDPSRFIEVGKRGTPTELTHIQATKAMQIGGGIHLTSNDAAVATYEDLKPVGTIGHRYVQRFESVEASFRHAIEGLDMVFLLPDLVDSYEGLETAMKLKGEYRDTGKGIFARLDSDLELNKKLTRLWLDTCAERGYDDPKQDTIAIEGLESLDEMREIETLLTEEEKKFVVHGAGRLLVSHETERRDASSGFKLSEYVSARGVRTPTNKFSDSPGKRSIPGQPTIATANGARVVAQIQEVEPGNDLFEALYIPGTPLREQTKPRDAFERCQAQYATLKPQIEAGTKTPISAATQQKLGEVMCRYGLTD